MKFNSAKILDKLRGGESDKKRVTIYVSESTFEKFKEACGDVPASVVLEELMELFVRGLAEEKTISE
jgi:hypothetical protein